MINRSRLEMDVRLGRVSRSIAIFFDDDLSSATFGLHQAAREHLDRFRSFLHSYYIEKNGFWPPAGFEDSLSLQRSTCRSMYSDFRNLYQYLADDKSSPAVQENSLVNGGVCIMQNVNKFDARHRYDTLPHPLPLIPLMPAVGHYYGSQSRNPVRRRKEERDLRNSALLQSLADSTNRNMNAERNTFVKRYAEFEQQSVFDEYENVSLTDARKVRWIVVYAILQILVSATRSPKQVRHTQGLSYPLCCQTPKVMPWKVGRIDPPSDELSTTQATKAELKPDIDYSPTNASLSSLALIGPQTSTKDNRRSLSSRSFTSPSAPLKASSIRLLLRRKKVRSNTASVDRPPFCEIYVPGYGNGLNEARVQNTLAGITTMRFTQAEIASCPSAPNVCVSRESSNASASSRCTDTELTGSLDMDHNSVNGDDVQTPKLHTETLIVNTNGEMCGVHCGTSQWDSFLNAR